MTLRVWQAGPKNLARAKLVLAADGTRRGTAVRCAGLMAALMAALVAGAAGNHLYSNERPGTWQQQTVPMQDVHQLQQALDHARLQLRVAQSHGSELEHQINALEQRASECQEELTFFRRGQNRKR